MPDSTKESVASAQESITSGKESVSSAKGSHSNSPHGSAPDSAKVSRANSADDSRANSAKGCQTVSVGGSIASDPQGSTGSESREESQMNMGMDQPFLGLKTAKCEEVSKDYKSGASFQGSVQNNMKTGIGTFIWPNGAKYSGEYQDNERHGKGVQEWPDGSRYEGQFHVDQRHGSGQHNWANGEGYSGQFFYDRRHGEGEYCWPDGSSYSGTFFMNQKEGYGKFTVADGKIFEGLYHNDEREGPGVLQYPDGRQDVGLWRRENLIKLCSDVSGAFTMKDHSEFDYNPDEHKLYITVEPPKNRTDIIDEILNPPEVFAYDPKVDVTKQTGEIFSDSLYPGCLAVDMERFNHSDGFEQRELATRSEKGIEVPEERESPVSVISPDTNPRHSAPPRPGISETKFEVNEEGEYLAWNNTPSMISMQKHIFRYQPASKRVSFDVDKVLLGDRSGFGEKGDAENDSQEFIQAAAEGDANKCYDMLNAGRVYVDVADGSGHTALLAAATNWHLSVINCMLDSGANVNKLNDEGISSLGACHTYFYPVETFQYNIAETYLETPPDLEKEEGYDVNEAIKGILGSNSKRKPSPEYKKGNNLENKRIHKLREEYGGVNDLPQVENPMAEIGSESFSNLKNENKRELGTLHIRRAVKIDVDQMMAYDKTDAALFQDYASRRCDSDADFSDIASEVSDFESERSIRNYPVDVSNQLIERGATALSRNDMVVSRGRSRVSHVASIGTVRRLAMDKSHQQLMQDTIRLLLKRGADPNASSVPMTVLFFAVKAADVDAVKLLLMKGASTSARLPEKFGGLYPLHIAVALPGEEGVRITELLLNSLADPDARAAQDDSFLNRNLEEEWSKDVIDEETRAILGGRTPLHIACARDDNYRYACKVVHLLLAHHANTGLLCNGHSPLALAIISGNDMAIDELLAYGADPCLPLSHGVGSALCIAASTEYEHRRNPEGRIKLIDKLIKSGADILAPIAIGPKRLIGTAVDSAYYMYNLDRRIAHMPYHALSIAERETFNARRLLLAHVGDILRSKAVELEKYRMQLEELEGKRSRSPSPNFVYTKGGAPLPPGIMRSRGGRAYPLQDSKVSFGEQNEGEIRRPLFRYCYECGRSTFVRLAACTRCKEVYYCSKACKLKAWNARHKEECVRIAGTGRSPSPSSKDKRDGSPAQAGDTNGTKTYFVSSKLKIPFFGRVEKKDPPKYKENYSYV